MKRPPAKRRLGQHFLHDPSILARIADATLAGPADTVLEIGPGAGALTARLLDRAGTVVAIERDRDLLEQLTCQAPGARIVAGDALDFDWYRESGAPAPSHWIVAGNIPYNITSPLLEKALGEPLPARVVFLVQLEVAERLAAPPGGREYGALTVGIRALAHVERLFRVPAGAFRPAPQVDSALVRLTPRDTPLVPPADRVLFRRFVTSIFGLRRKQIGGALRQVTGRSLASIGEVLSGMNVRQETRAETLPPEAFRDLYQRLVDGGPGAC